MGEDNVVAGVVAFGAAWDADAGEAEAEDHVVLLSSGVWQILGGRKCEMEGHMKFEGAGMPRRR